MCFLRPQKLTKSSPSIWHLLHNVKSTVKISSIFVAFLENMNFKYMDQNTIIKRVYLSSIWISKIKKFSFLRTQFSIMVQCAVLLHLLDEGTHILVPREKMLKGFFSILERERDWVERAAERRMNQQVHENGQNSTHYYWVRFHAALMLLPTAHTVYVGRTHR